MARIKLTMPEKIVAEVCVPVRITDLNYGNHVGNDTFVSIIHEARVQWLYQHNFSELNIGGAGLIMGELAIEYKNEAFYEDLIRIDIGISDITRKSFDLYYQLTTTRNGSKTILAIAKTGMVCYDYTAKKITSIPEEFFSVLNEVF